MAKLVECIPNFSLSKEKNEAGYNALIEVAKSVPGCIHCFLGGRMKKSYTIRVPRQQTNLDPLKPFISSLL